MSGHIKGNQNNVDIHYNIEEEGKGRARGPQEKKKAVKEEVVGKRGGQRRTREGQKQMKQWKVWFPSLPQ